ncbi:MAG: SUMF1/EgtB/PvdO family nonheme iron enzyme [Planctomycetota bacterium]
MAGSISDEAFAHAVQQLGGATFEQLEAARAEQAAAAARDTPLSLAEVLVRQGLVTPAIRENIERKLQAEQAGGLQQLGPYKLLKKLGEGGMGAVYLAEDTMAGRKVAVKVLPKKYSDEREFLTRFRREAQSTGKLNHANIVVAYNVGEDAGTHYYAMEYCEGETLDRVLKRQQRLPWDSGLEIAAQVARGLKHAHDHGVIHRDIKPANIFICAPIGSAGVPPATGSAGVSPATGSAGVSPATPEAGGTPALPEGFVAKILDLGLSKNISGEEQSFYTQSGAIVGTPHYISPEQARGDKGIDGRTDVYSLGATLYHLLTGQTPFQASTALAILNKHLTEELPNPQDIVPDIPDGVVQVIMRMMAKDPNDRYANCAELLADLEEVAQGKLPSSQAIDVGKSSVAVARVPRASRPPVPLAHARGSDPSRDRKGAVPLAHARGSEAARDTREQQPVERRRTGRRAADDVPLVELRPIASSRKRLYIGAGVLGLGLLALIVGLALNKSETENPKSEGNSNTETAKPEPPTPIPATVEPAVAKAEELPKEIALDLGGGVEMDMVLVPAGEFMMGAHDAEARPEEKPVHEVKISKPFYMGKYLVTQEQYQAVMGKNPSTFKGQKRPVEHVSWLEGQEFCRMVSQKTGKAVRLPTEAEWEYACRAGTTARFYTGDQDKELENAGWFNGNSGGKTHPVGQKAPNAWGLYDMHGNEWEWVQDYFNDKYYAESPSVDPKGPDNGGDRVLRGGSWLDGPDGCRAARRHRHTLGGFRSALDLPGGGAPAAVPPATPNPKPETGVTDAWIKMVQGLPAEKQVEEVVKKLKEMNPGYDGKSGRAIEGGEVVELSIWVPKVTNIASVRAFPRLKRLYCIGDDKDAPLADLSPVVGMSLQMFDCADTRVCDLSPLKGMPLRALALQKTQVSDLAPLIGMPLEILKCYRTNVRNLSPLKSLPLRELHCDFVPERDAAILRSIKTLETINGMPVAEFWKKVDAELAAKAATGADRPWKPIFDGKTLDCLSDNRKGTWRVENGAIVNASGNASCMTKTQFGDGEVRVRFEAADCTYMNIITFAGGAGIHLEGTLNKPHLQALAGRQQELLVLRRGTDVSASVNGEALKFKVLGPPSSQASIQFYVADGTLRLQSIEYRELAPNRLEVGQKDKEGWTCIFNGRDLTGWNVQGGKPRAEDGSLIFENTAKARRPLTSTAFELRGLIRLLRAEIAGVGVIELTDDNNKPGIGVKFHLSGGVHILGPEGTILANSGSKGLSKDNWQQFNVRVAGDGASVEAEGKPLITATVKAPRGAAFLAIRAYGGATELRMKDLWLRELGPDGKPLGAAQPDAAALPKELSLDLGAGVKMDFVLIPAGEFMMGSDDGGPDEKPVHKVKISKAFYIGKFLVTQEQYEAVMGKNPANFKAPKNPVETVSWDDAQEFCKKATANHRGTETQRNGTVRLPAEAEWEYACRAGTTTKFYTGDNVSDLEQAGWFTKNSGDRTNAVGQKKPNAWGLYDMHGNVWEWVQDYFGGKYDTELPTLDPKGAAKGGGRVLRGGEWGRGPEECRAANRHRDDPGYRSSHVGFRCALDF